MKRVLTILLFLIATPAWADSGSPDLLPASLKVFGSLAVVLGIVLVLYVLARKGMGGLLPAAKSGAIRIVETRHLGAKKSLCLVEVRGEELLLGVGGERIELLSRLGRREEGSFAETLEARLGEK